MSTRQRACDNWARGFRPLRHGIFPFCWTPFFLICKMVGGRRSAFRAKRQQAANGGHNPAPVQQGQPLCSEKPNMMPLSHYVPRPSRYLVTLLISGDCLLAMLLAVSWAQVPTTITPDGTLGTAVIQNGNVYDITGGTRPGNGPNLFHSFDRFSVGTHNTARFSGPTGIENILSRVTGGQQSLIDGRLQSTIAGANLYLLNPSGVLFGPNASLDVSGSFHVSTADYLRFADGTKFSANLGQESVLSVASPTAFGFLGSHPAGITIQGSSLKVSGGKALSVVGGDMTIMGSNGPLTTESVRTLSAPSGRIQMASVASPGEVIFSPLELAPDLQVDSFAQLGRIELSPYAFVDASGNGGGTVLLRSGRLLVGGSFIFADNTGPRNGMGWALTWGSGRTPLFRIVHSSPRIVWEPDGRGICG
jgi:filamentous hemagglutinin family protein